MQKINQFKPAWWLKNRHLQSCYSSLLPYRAKTPLRWEELILPDGDFLDVAWAGKAKGPLAILLHGLEGSVYSHYIQLLLDELVSRGWQAAVMHYRTCSGRINRLPQSYNGGDVRDLTFFIKTVAKRFPDVPLYAVGFSLGGNILIHYLAKQQDSPLTAVAAISTPYEMNKSADYLAGFYQKMLLKSMKKKVLDKIQAGISMPCSAKEVANIKNLRQFDAMLTAPLYGYPTVDDYYYEASCRFILHQIKHPLLIIHALDDPFIPVNSVPQSKELASNTIIEISDKGGHVGFITGGFPWNPNYWLKSRIMNYLEECQRKNNR